MVLRTGLPGAALAVLQWNLLSRHVLRRGDDLLDAESVAGAEVGDDLPVLLKLQHRGDVEHLVGGKHVLALEDRRERLAGHEFHHEVGAALLLAVVEDVRDALVVDQRGVTRLAADTDLTVIDNSLVREGLEDVFMRLVETKERAA
jgi:hypothetical protein